MAKRAKPADTFAEIAKKGHKVEIRSNRYNLELDQTDWNHIETFITNAYLELEGKPSFNTTRTRL